MSKRFVQLCLVPGAVLATVIGMAALAQPADLTALDIAAGKALFDKTWVQAPASTTSSDGLGPHFSSRSCAACHPGGGRGSGPQSNTLQLNDPVYGLRLHSQSLALVPGEAQVVWKPILQPDSTDTGGWLPEISELAYGALQSPVSVRLAPSLAGTGLLELVPIEALVALEDPQDLDGNGISGRIAWAEQTAQGLLPGRFGWKASAVSLAQQTAIALSLDIGVSSPLYPDAWGDCTEQESACRMRSAAREDQLVPEASQTVVDLLVEFVRSLVPPAHKFAERGENLFQLSACAGCHVPELPSSAGPVRAFTDLLLHDMGPELDDGLAEGAAMSSEWRTAPLWTLPATGPYLHDGRAGSLEAALELHGGEASGSRQAYRQLNGSDRSALTAYLLGL